MFAKKHLFLISIITIFCSCKNRVDPSLPIHINHTEKSRTNPFNDTLKINKSNTIENRITVPFNYEREVVSLGSFQESLRTLKLKPKGSLVRYYDGRTKSNSGIYTDVVDLEIGNKDLHQCADAVMRLRAEYLWHASKFEKIHFNFTNGHKVEYSEWMKGKRMNVDGNRSWWSLDARPSNTYQDFWNYMELIFSYAGTASLEKEMVSINLEDAEIGDVFIQGGFPGHAIIIVDAAKHQQTGQTIFLLAQSYMPAQEIQILANPNDDDLSPWYSIAIGELKTPEWTFRSGDLRRFAFQ